MALPCILKCIARSELSSLDCSSRILFSRFLSPFPRNDLSYLRSYSSCRHPSVFTTYNRFISTEPERGGQSLTDNNITNEDTQNKPTLVQRFKGAYKVYGKVLLVVHGVTSVAWLGLFYLVAYSGVNVVDALQAVNAPNWVINPLLAHGLGIWATALVLYKLASPLRYAFTLGATRSVVHGLRNRGAIPPIPEEDKLRSLARQGAALSRVRLLKTRDNLRRSIRMSKQKFRRNRPKN